MLIDFYKRDNRWFADLPQFAPLGVTEDDCEMVAGADAWLDIIAQGEDTVSLRLEEHDFANAEMLQLETLDDFYDGATYRICSWRGIDYNHLCLWLCPVTLLVFGKYPMRIYYSS